MVGSVTTQGDRLLQAPIARRNFHLDGCGVTVGVISDSFNVRRRAQRNVRSGDLPGIGNPLGYRQPVRVLRDRSTGSDEGRAMLQIITDLAPGAKLLFHTAYAPNQRAITQQSFSTAVRALVRAGADIIVDDVGFAAPLFQDGLAAQTVTQAADRGVLYFSAIGNDGNRSYSSVFRPGSEFTYQGQTYVAHDFDPDEGVDLFQDITLPFSTQIAPLLGWDQPIGQVNQSFKLFLLDQPQFPNAGANLLSVSVSEPIGDLEQPLEQLAYRGRDRQMIYLVIASKANPELTNNQPSQVKWISTANDGDRDVTYEYVNIPGEPETSTIYGHPNASGAIAIGAVRFANPGRFDRSNPRLAEFSSRGGTPILFDAAGTRLSMPEIRVKPELVAPDAVATSLEAFRPFSGTSAAAPHAAGVAALMLQRFGQTPTAQPAPRMIVAKISQVLQQTATPIDPPGNFRTGAGLISASQAVLQLFQSQTIGTVGGDRLGGNRFANNLWGGGGHDRLSGRRGFDALFGETGADELRGDTGNDYLQGGRGNDQLWGGRGHDTLRGSNGFDQLRGGSGDDWLSGGRGINQLLGGRGSDRFLIHRDGVAIIRDFQPQRDRLQLSDRLKFSQLQFVPRDTAQPELVIQSNNATLARLIGFTGELTAAYFRSDF